MDEVQSVEEWVALLGGGLPEDRVDELLTHAVTALDERIRSVPRIEARVGEIIARRLNDGITVETWGALHERLGIYLGGQLPWLLWTFLVSEDVRDETERLASKEVLEFLQTITVIYGPDLNKVFAYANEDPDDWATIEKGYFIDIAKGGPRVGVTIEKYDGERMKISGPPDTALNLASAMIELATGVPPDAFTEGALQQFHDRVQEVLEHLASEEADEDVDTSS